MAGAVHRISYRDKIIYHHDDFGRAVGMADSHSLGGVQETMRDLVVCAMTDEREINTWLYVK